MLAILATKPWLPNLLGEEEPVEVVRANTSSRGNTPSPVAYKMPAAMVEKSAASLCWISLFCAITTVALLTMEALLQPEFASAFNLLSIRLTILVVLVMSLGFLAIQRYQLVRKETLLDLGIAFQVVIAFAISMFETTFPWNPQAAVLGHSGVAIWLALCGLLLPNSPAKSGIAAVLSALAWPAAYYLNLNLHGFAPLPWNRLL